MKLFPRGCCKEKHFNNTWKVFLERACVRGSYSVIRVCVSRLETRSLSVRVSSVCVFYDSECIPFELHAIYMCVLYFFSKRRGSVCTRTKFLVWVYCFFELIQAIFYSKPKRYGRYWFE